MQSMYSCSSVRSLKLLNLKVKLNQQPIYQYDIGKELPGVVHIGHTSGAARLRMYAL